MPATGQEGKQGTDTSSPSSSPLLLGPSYIESRGPGSSLGESAGLASQWNSGLEGEAWHLLHHTLQCVPCILCPAPTRPRWLRPAEALGTDFQGLSWDLLC